MADNDGLLISMVFRGFIKQGSYGFENQWLVTYAIYIAVFNHILPVGLLRFKAMHIMGDYYNLSVGRWYGVLPVLLPK